MFDILPSPLTYSPLTYSRLSPIPFSLHSSLLTPHFHFRAGGYEIGAFRGIKKRFFSGHGRRNRSAFFVWAAAKWPEKGRLSDAENAFPGVWPQKDCVAAQGVVRQHLAATPPFRRLLGF